MPDTSPSLKLYHAVPSRSATVRWMLEEIGEPYEIELLDLKAGDQAQAGYLAVNPMGKVPTLLHDGVAVTEAAAICCYLADAFPATALAPAVTDKHRGPYLKWLFFAPSCIEPAMIDKALSRPSVPRGIAGWADYETVVSVLTNALSRSPYMLGDLFTTADVVVGSTIRWGVKFKLLPDNPEFLHYIERLEARPALQRQIAKDEDRRPPPA
jgi:glutathione S-transferase